MSSPFPSRASFERQLGDYYRGMARIDAKRSGSAPLFIPDDLLTAFCGHFGTVYETDFLTRTPNDSLKLADPRATFSTYLKTCNEFLQGLCRALPYEACVSHKQTFLYRETTIDLCSPIKTGVIAEWLCKEQLKAVGLFDREKNTPSHYYDFLKSMPRFYESEPIYGTPEDRRVWRARKKEFDETELAKWKEEKKKYEETKKKADKERRPMQEALAGSLLYPQWYLVPSTYTYRVPFELSTDARMRHQWVISPTGGGKTTLLESQIINDIDAVARGECAVVVIDSRALPGKRSLINDLSRLKVFAPGQPLYKKLVLLEPDPAYPLALNLFDLGKPPPKNEREKHQFNAEAGKLIQFSIAAMTDPQADLFSYVVQLLLTIPDATVRDLEVVLGENGLYGERYQTALSHADETVQTFFKTYESAGQFGTTSTREAVLRRVLGMLKVPTVRRMFLAKENRFNMLNQISEPKVILINTDMSLLEEEACESFGRFFIAQLVHAMHSRTSDLPVYVYVDEMHEYLSNDKNLETLNDKARARNIGMIYAHQRISHIKSPGVLDSLQSLAVQFAGGNRKDAKELAALLQATEEDIRSVPRGTFMLYVDKDTPSAIRVKVRELYSQRETMTDDELRSVKQRMRDLYSYPYAQKKPKDSPKQAKKPIQKPVAPPPPTVEPDDDNDATPFI